MQKEFLNENENEDENNSGSESAKTEQIIESGIVATKNAKHAIHCLTIIGQIVIMGND